MSLPLCDEGDADCEDRNRDFDDNAYTDYQQHNSLASQYYRVSCPRQAFIYMSRMLVTLNQC